MNARRYRVYLWEQQKLTNDITGFECDLGEIEGVFIDGDYHKIEEDVVEITQSTGLFDKQGVEIYEDDIIESLTPLGDTVIETVAYEECDDFFGRGYRLYSNECEVIGNIYENKELLDVN